MPLQGLNETEHDHQQTNCSYQELPAAVDNFKLCMYCFLLLGSLFGNIFIIIIVYKHRDLQKTVNYFIVNMAVSDLVFPLALLPLEIVSMATGSTLTRWYVDGIFGSITCKSIHFVAQVSPAVSSQSFVWIAIDRFVAILFPVRLGLVSRKIRVIAIASTWILAAAINSNHLVSQDLHIRDNKTFCEVKLVSAITEETYFAIFYYMQLFLNTFGSFFLSVVLYTAIAVSLHKQSKALANSGPNIQRNVFKKRKRAIQLSAVTMVTYYLTVTIPMLSYLQHRKVFRFPCNVMKVVSFMGDLCQYASTVINPVICLSFVHSYRQGLRNILCYCFRTRRDETGKREQKPPTEMKSPSTANCRNRRNCKVSANNDEILDTAL